MKADSFDALVDTITAALPHEADPAAVGSACLEVALRLLVAEIGAEAVVEKLNTAARTLLLEE